MISMTMIFIHGQVVDQKPTVHGATCERVSDGVYRFACWDVEAAKSSVSVQVMEPWCNEMANVKVTASRSGVCPKMATKERPGPSWPTSIFTSWP